MEHAASAGETGRCGGEAVGVDEKFRAAGISSAAEGTPLIVVAGVPGAGKTEALRTLRVRSPRARLADPEGMRRRLRHWLPWLPYGIVRPILHTIAHLRVLAQIFNKPGGPLVIHDPGTRRWSRRLIVRLAGILGYRPMIVFIDTDRDSALCGQAQRKRLVRRRAFDRHWRRWSELRERILRGDSLGDGEPWGRVVLSHRGAVVDDVLGLLDTAAAV
ncbi:AAA family ATPase [Brevibacterium epidermidis]|uniref:AAA family ATPase n=1 Tax=Brevibacterium epidermidis TaxID=1698 RepID=UPI000BF5E721|nr:AAA family ATPase [Brevibacterium epidermidis]